MFTDVSNRHLMTAKIWNKSCIVSSSSHWTHIFCIFLSSSGSVDSIFWIQRLCAHCKALLSSHRLSMGNSHPTLVQPGTFLSSSNFKVLELFLFAQFKICRRKIQLKIHSKSDFIQPVHMGQIPQDRENGQNAAFFISFWLWLNGLIFFTFSQMLWRDFVH